MIMVEESTRRLPNWMLGVSVAADNDNNNKKNITDEPEDEEDGANLAKNSKFEAKRRKRNQVKDNKELDDDTDNDVNKKTSNRPGRKRKAKSKAEIKAEYEEEEGEELTVEDLVNIAEEDFQCQQRLANWNCLTIIFIQDTNLLLRVCQS